MTGIAFENATAHRLIPAIVYAGRWDLGGATIFVTRRPNWFQRQMYRLAFGWRWVPTP